MAYVISARKRLVQEDCHRFETSPGYRVRPCLQNKQPPPAKKKFPKPRKHMRMRTLIKGLNSRRKQEMLCRPAMLMLAPEKVWHQAVLTKT